MKKRKIIVITIVILLILGIVGTCIGNKIRKNRIELEIQMVRYDSYCRILCMPGLQEEDYDDLRHVVMDAQPNEEERKELLIKVAYYNLEMGKDVTMEQVLDSYNAFLAGDEEGSALIESFYNSFYNGSNAEIGSENVFRDTVVCELIKEGENIETASEEQVEAAIQYVIAHPELVLGGNNERPEREIGGEEYRKYREYSQYSEVLCMERQTISRGDGVIIIYDTKPKPDENELRIKVAYYNLEMGEDVTMEQVLDSYNAFLAGDEEGSALIESFYNSFYYGRDAEIGSEDAFHDAVVCELDKIGEDIETASEEQVEAAIQYVIAHPELVLH